MQNNIQKQMDEFLAKLKESDNVPKLLLHSCCAPCSSYVIAYLSECFYITVFYYNPNIYPDTEYRFRAEEQKRFIAQFPARFPVDYIEGDYDPKVFYEISKGLENEPEKGARCTRCFKLRLGETARVAADKGMDYFATTLTLSPLKNANLINEIGKEEGERYKSVYLPSEFRKKDGFLKSTQISKEYGMYRQDYCGCEFSMRK